MLKLYAAVPEVYEKILLGQAVLGAYRTTMYDVMSRVTIHALYFGRWRTQRLVTLNEADPVASVCLDVSFEALSMYVAENKGDLHAVELLHRLRRNLVTKA